MEHGGGNNSHLHRVVTSFGHLLHHGRRPVLPEGPPPRRRQHQVIEMIQDIKSHLHDWTDPDGDQRLPPQLLNKEAFDHSGLICGMGPRSTHLRPQRADPPLLREPAGRGEGRQDDLALYRNIERRPKLISKNRPIYKGSAPTSTCTAGSSTTCWASRWNCTPPLFAIARIVGWSARPHRGGAGVHEQDHPPACERRPGAG